MIQLSEEEMRQVRGKRISMILQDPQTSLNPVFNIGNQLVESLGLGRKEGRKSLMKRAADSLRNVNVAAPERRLEDFPHQMSGGMKQRVVGAIAMSLEPSIIIADEPTTALDVTIQAQIMDLLAELQSDSKMSILLITHNLGLVAEGAHHVAVMYASIVVEYTSTRELFVAPLHPYTHGQLTSVPTQGMPKDRELNVIPGQVPNPLHFPPGCKFHPRCPLAEERCRKEEPLLEEVQPGHWAACHLIKGGDPAPLWS